MNIYAMFDITTYAHAYYTISTYIHTYSLSSKHSRIHTFTHERLGISENEKLNRQQKRKEK